MGASDYDRVIRTYIPGYEEMLDTIGWWLSKCIPGDGKVIDLGGGTGALAEAIVTRLPRVSLEIWDIDPKMLAVADTRLKRFGSRVKLRERSFMEKIDSCDAVVASLSLHHLPKMETKRSVYTNIREALRKPGVFLNGDCTLDKTEPGRGMMFRWWAEFMRTHGVSQADAHQHFTDWQKEDTYFPLADELITLAEAGFRVPDCFWKKGPMSIYGGLATA